MCIDCQDDDIFCTYWYTGWEFEIFVKNVGKCLLPCLSPEWRVSIEHFIQKNSLGKEK